MSEVKLEDIVSLAKRRGFIYPGSDIYGGMAGVYDYGPLGVRLKRNIQDVWLKFFVDGWDDMYQVDAAILMNKQVWEASGHVTGFTDPMIECLQCNTRFRADKFVPGLPKSSTDALWMEKWVDAYREIHGFKDGNDLKKAATATTTSYMEKKIICPSCGQIAEFTEPEQFNMMFKTIAGAKFTSTDNNRAKSLRAHVEFINEDDNIDATFDLKDEFNELSGFMFYDSNAASYLRPETAQGIFVNFKNVMDSFYPDLPFGIAQIGKAFRNEISPREFLFRLRELEQMEIEYFVEPDKWEESFEKWRKDTHAFFKKIGLPEDKIHELEVPETDRAHYSKRTIDFEFDYPFGRRELSGLAYRTDYDLTHHQEASGKSMAYRPKDGGDAFIPHVIEPSFGVDRALLAVLASAYTEDEIEGEKRIYLKLDPSIAPVKVAVSPLLKNKPELVEKAREVYKMLKKEVGSVMWDDNGNIGKRYRRQDEIGTPYCVTIDFQTLEDDTVTVRHRDTTEQSRKTISELPASL